MQDNCNFHFQLGAEVADWAMLMNTKQAATDFS